MDDRLEDIQLRLEAISEELGDLSMDLLREAVDAGETQRPPLDKMISRVRRSVDKAATLIGREV